MGRHKGSKTGIRNYNYYICEVCNSKFKRALSYPSERARFCSQECHGSYVGSRFPKEHFKKMTIKATSVTRGKTFEEIHKNNPKMLQKVKDIVKRNTEKRMIKIDLDELKKQYYKHKSSTKIAEIFGCSKNAIRSRLKQLGLDTNPNKGISSGTFRKGHNFHGKKQDVVKKIKENKERGRNISKAMRENFKNPEFVNEWVKKHKVNGRLAPNKKERLIIGFFKQNNLPYKFTGDGSFWIEGKNPDFINENDKKIIEIFGIYWHSPILNRHVNYNRTYEGTIKFYQKRGYECLIVWDYELERTPEKAFAKILGFATNTNILIDENSNPLYNIKNPIEIDFREDQEKLIIK